MNQLDLSGSVAVIGDVMLDVYLHGEVNRISPEAPVPVVEVTGKSKVLGGAANVALNLANLGCRTWLFGARGQDRAGTTLEAMLGKKEIIHALYVHKENPTTCKTRVVAGSNQQLIRFDEEKPLTGLDELNQFVIIGLSRVIEDGLGAVVLSDYGKGLLSPCLLSKVIRICKASGIPVLVDPQRSTWEGYHGATLVKPNIYELRAAIGDPGLEDQEAICQAAKSLAVRHNIQMVLVTLGPRGMILVMNGARKVTPAVAREVFDVSGAGDTVIAVMAACICSGWPADRAAQLANLAAGIVVGKSGTQAINLKELQHANQAAVDRL